MVPQRRQPSVVLGARRAVGHRQWERAMMGFVWLGVKVGAAYALGEIVGGKIAAKVNAGASDGIRRGIKIGTGVASFVVISAVVG